MYMYVMNSEHFSMYFVFEIIQRNKQKKKKMRCKHVIFTLQFATKVICLNIFIFFCLHCYI